MIHKLCNNYIFVLSAYALLAFYNFSDYTNQNAQLGRNM